MVEEIAEGIDLRDGCFSPADADHHIHPDVVTFGKTERRGFRETQRLPPGRIADRLPGRLEVAAANAALLAAAMSADLDDDVSDLDVLDWLASTGLTLVQDDGDAVSAYLLLIAEGADPEQP